MLNAACQIVCNTVAARPAHSLDRCHSSKMSLVDTLTDVNGITWGKYQDDEDPTQFFYVRSE